MEIDREEREATAEELGRDIPNTIGDTIQVSVGGRTLPITPEIVGVTFDHLESKIAYDPELEYPVCGMAAVKYRVGNNAIYMRMHNMYVIKDQELYLIVVLGYPMKIFNISSYPKLPSTEAGDYTVGEVFREIE